MESVAKREEKGKRDLNGSDHPALVGMDRIDTRVA